MPIRSPFERLNRLSTLFVPKRDSFTTGGVLWTFVVMINRSKYMLERDITFTSVYLSSIASLTFPTMVVAGVS